MECLHLHTGISHTENICVCKFPGKQREEQEESTFIFSLSSKAEVAIICLLYLGYLQGVIFNPYLLNYWIWLDKCYLWIHEYHEYLWNIEVWSLSLKAQFQKGKWLKYILDFCCCVAVVTWCDGEESNTALVFFAEYFNFIPWLS